MRWASHIILCSALTGCFPWWGGDETADPTLPPASAGKSTPVDRYADAADEVMDIAAAAVGAAKDANAAGRHAEVGPELNVAAAALPRPTPAASKAAASRVSAASAAIYAQEVARADRLQRDLDTLWASVEAEKQAARDALAAKQQELDAERAAKRDLLWTGAGLLITTLGLAAAIWGRAFGVTKVEAGLVVLGGLAIGSLPWALESDLSAWVVAPLAGLALLRGVVWIWSQGWGRPRQS